MTEKAVSAAPSSFAAAMLAHTRDGKSRHVEKVVTLNARNVEPPTSDSPAPRSKVTDFSSAIDLIHEASAAIKISEQRANDLESQMQGLMDHASEEVRRLGVEIAEKDAQIAKTVEQLRAAEARAHEAETWLARLHDAVMTEFEPLQQSRS